MKEFGKWFSDFKLPKPASVKQIDMLPEGISTAPDGSYVALCCSCDSWKPLYCDISEVPMNGYQHYCGGSQRCCP